ncbi:MAG TPA: ABC transporter ATP-binding protein [Candidatus Limnocylindrales bacterium]|jgi:multiple sugar transport system ATP-binding protein
MAELEIRGLTKVFPGGVRALDGLDLNIQDGEFFALLGPSGCGKTTLLRSIAGLETPNSGQIHIGGRDVTRLPPAARDVAMVFQDYALYPHMTVADNIAYPLKVRRVGRKERRETAESVGRSLQIQGAILDRRPGQLSGGQQQRVALARAIAYQPRVFLFDEPLSNLDARLRLEARTFLKQLQRELGVTTVYVTHDQAEALALADRMAVMDQGRIRQLDTPSNCFLRPANTFVAAFIGSTPMNLLPAKVQDGGLEVAGQKVMIPEAIRAQVRVGDPVILGVRPEYVSVSPTELPDSLAGTVRVLENLGVDSLVTVEVGDLRVQATVPEERVPAVGDRVWLAPDQRRLLAYRQADGEQVGAPTVALSDTPALVPGAG